MVEWGKKWENNLKGLFLSFVLIFNSLCLSPHPHHPSPPHCEFLVKTHQQLSRKASGSQPVLHNFSAARDLCLFKLFMFMRFLWQEYWSGLPFPPLVGLGGHLEMLLAVRGGGGRCAQSCAGLSFAWMFFVEIHLGTISWCVRISQTNLELSNAFFP